MTDSLFTRVTREIPIRSVSVSLIDLESIARLVMDKNRDALVLELSEINKLVLDEKTRVDRVTLLEQTNIMTIFINGRGGDNLIAYSPDVFKSHLLPTHITSVTIETQTRRQVVTNSDPTNYIRVHFDFSKLIFTSPQFTPTGTLLNVSLLRINGNNDAWVVGTFQAINERLNAVKNARSFLHGSITYQFGLYVLILPAVALLMDQTYRNYNSYFDNLGPVTKFGTIAYGFLLSAIAFRLFFNYALWVFPTVELINERDRSTKHRKFLFTVLTSLLVGAISYYTFKR